METCENCHRQIGDLEAPYLFKQHVVCKECHGRLSGQYGTPTTCPPEAQAPPIPPPSRISVTTSEYEQYPSQTGTRSPTENGWPTKALVALGVIVAVATLIITVALHFKYQQEKNNGWYVAMNGTPDRPEYLVWILGGMFLALILVVIGLFGRGK